jgi:hypothetical protein
MRHNVSFFEISAQFVNMYREIENHGGHEPAGIANLPPPKRCKAT